jgi:exosortase
MNQQSTPGILEDLRIDVQEAWRQLPNKLFFFVLLAGWLLLFQFLGNSTLGYVHSPSLFRWMLDAYHPSGDYSASEDVHGLIVPPVVLVLFWLKRKELLSLPLRIWSPGLVLLGLALLLHIVGYMIQQPRVSILALLAGIYALMALAWGPAWMRGSLFPFVLLIFCVPLGAYGQIITTPLRHLVAVIVTGIAHLGLSPDLIREGTMLMDANRTFSYDIAPACSGIRSLVSLLALTTVFGFISFPAGWKRWLIVLAAFPLAVLGNVVRISFAVVIAELLGQKAGVAVEQKAGFITFVIAIIAIILLEKGLRGRDPQSQSSLPFEPKTT